MARSDPEWVIGDCHLRAAGALQRFDLRFANISNRRVASSAIRVERDFGALHSQNLADQWIERRRYSARWPKPPRIEPESWAATETAIMTSQA
jgi:hypothetical protein